MVQHHHHRHHYHRLLAINTHEALHLVLRHTKDLTSRLIERAANADVSKERFECIRVTIIQMSESAVFTKDTDGTFNVDVLGRTADQTAEALEYLAGPKRTQRPNWSIVEYRVR